jgi:hypothetical protein
VTPHPVSRYVPLLIEGDLQGLLDLFGDAPRVNDPRLGWIEGARFEPFVAASHEGLSERQARVEHRTTTFTNRGAVEECVLSLVRRDRTIRLPVAIAAVISSDTLAEVHVLLPHQAGIAVYERARTGLLAATRIYDDVELPSLPN